MESHGHVAVTKASGERERFDVHKLTTSLLRAGASKNAAELIAQHIVHELKDGMHTSYIYKHAFNLLRKIEERPVAARYSLRRAVLELGPSGFPFEDYLAEIFSALGFKTSTRQNVKGKCAYHEIDLLAHNEKIHLGAEIKFHNSLGIKTDLKVVLYVHARFLDIHKYAKEGHKDGLMLEEMWLMTNTKFTKNTISYARCAGLNLLGWNYPHKRNLQTLIEETQVYPITCLPSLTKREKSNLLTQNLVLCKDLSGNEKKLEKAGVPPARITTVIEESQALCSSGQYLE